jgi:hypothetical protein
MTARIALIARRDEAHEYRAPGRACAVRRRQCWIAEVKNLIVPGGVGQIGGRSTEIFVSVERETQHVAATM